MWPDLVPNPGPLALPPDELPTAPRGPASSQVRREIRKLTLTKLLPLNVFPFPLNLNKYMFVYLHGVDSCRDWL